ncbi:hypothetical protein HU200_061675 [Digitaria exilis]|uniref:F-box domain-containing protein n=1 Tax=Digitaria exilis TaxID=1010633 RepID=A0A835DWG3_9POAL|nr:hypothetical protein HU200_061675 [Digitaria exilis]
MMNIGAPSAPVVSPAPSWRNFLNFGNPFRIFVSLALKFTSAFISGPSKTGEITQGNKGRANCYESASSSMATASPTSAEATAAVNNEGLNLPTDALVDILLRLSPIYRRLVRLVCRHWRDVIDERTPQIQPPKVLAFFSSSKSASAYVVDDLAGGKCRKVWGVSADPDTKTSVDVTMVGTCNGLLCLCDNKKPGGTVAVFNPVTREKLRIPKLPVSYRGGYSYGTRDTYTFG